MFLLHFDVFFSQVLCHNLCFLMCSKLFSVVVGLWEAKTRMLFVALWLKVESQNTQTLELDVM